MKYFMFKSNITVLESRTHYLQWTHLQNNTFLLFNHIQINFRTSTLIDFAAETFSS